MCNYLDNNNQRELFVDTIREKLIGPGADVFGVDAENELIAKNPTKLYYAGILFSKAFSNPDAQVQDDLEEIVPDDNDPIPDGDGDDNTPKLEEGKDDMEAANLRFQSFYPDKFGLVFAVEDDTNTIDVTFNYATYIAVNDRKIKISQTEWDTLTPLLDQIHQTIIDEFDVDLFNPIRFSYINNELTFDYNADVRAFISNNSTRYYAIVNNVFRNNVQLKKNKYFKLCAKNVYKRAPQAHTLQLPLNNADGYIVDGHLKYYLKVMQRDGKKIVKILVKNESVNEAKSYSDCYFQVQIKVTTNALVDYKNPFNNVIDEDFATVDYQYRNVVTYGKGINCAVTWNNGQSIETTFLPQEEIKSFSNVARPEIKNAGVGDILKLKNLSIWTQLEDEEIIEKLRTFVGTYGTWIAAQIDNGEGHPIANDLTSKQTAALNRLNLNIDYLKNNLLAFRSFKLANTAMFIQMIIAKNNNFKKGRSFNQIDGFENTFNNIAYFQNYIETEPAYYPFQLAFLLMNVEPTFNKDSLDRKDIVDLIWFPTGGGKTEAYLALTALTIIERRLNNPGIDTVGVSVLMRYTLRLLTAQQFERATWLICALEFMRIQLPTQLPDYHLGDNEITIGMWVGGSTTPNNFNDLMDLRWSNVFLPADVETRNRANKFPISYCPWCGCNLIDEHGFGYERQMNGGKVSGLDVYCINENCHFSGSLPIMFIDEQLYNNPPTLLFATVDKMVQLSHKENARNLFFTGPLPPDLIIQDELHLLTGPLGSLTGLYELVIEQLCCRGGRKPKIVASTATTRNTASLVKSMFGRGLNIFPAQGITYNDNFFSFLDENSKRKHVGVMPTGKTAGLTEIKIVEALYEAKIKLLKCFLVLNNIDITNIAAIVDELNSNDFKNDIDPYWTFVFYYNNLRDLGRSKSRVSIDFKQQIDGMFEEQGFEKALKFISNNMFGKTVEFTSRQESGKIKSLLNRTEQAVSFVHTHRDGHEYINQADNTIDLALASNMFSVGIDVNRLNIMLMIGQTGSVAEYIQASSRVARKDKGIVINLLNPMRARELSIFEDYSAFHATYYKNVEPLSITPFTNMALDKLLDAVLVGYVRNVNNIHNVAGFNVEMKNELMRLINVNTRNISQEQLNYLSAKLDSLAQQWINAPNQTPPINNISNIYELMNSLRDIDSDVYIENKSL